MASFWELSIEKALPAFQVHFLLSVNSPVPFPKEDLWLFNGWLDVPSIRPLS
jgi:hypothetical protein